MVTPWTWVDCSFLAGAGVVAVDGVWAKAPVVSAEALIAAKPVAARRAARRVVKVMEGLLCCEDPAGTTQSVAVPRVRRAR
jgi:hypothetical protein